MLVFCVCSLLHVHFYMITGWMLFQPEGKTGTEYSPALYFVGLMLPWVTDAACPK